ncbi:MAG: glycosyltransferase family 4 protein [Patescibacteria group bacterium]|nr:glycosyltransferase family 4 protein [Patescibacteria group bacterium]
MKILIVSNLYPPEARGGAERVAELQARGFRDAGHEVAVLSSGPRGFACDKADGIKICRFFPLNIFWYKNIGEHGFAARAIWHALDAMSLAGLGMMRRAIREEVPDLIVSHNLRGLGMLGVLALKAESERWVHVAHDIQLSAPNGLMLWGEEAKAERSFVRKIWEAYSRRLFGSPRLIVSPSRWLAEFYKNKGFFKDSRVEVLPNPAPLAGMAEKILHPGLNLLYLGQIEKHKGARWLVETLKDLPGDWHLAVAGGGSDLGEIKKIAAGDARINILGPRPREEIGRLFSGADLAIVPSFCYENSPAVISESLAAGVPVLVSRIGGAGELVRQGENGWTFTPGAKDELLAKIKPFIADPARLAGMSEACRKTVAEYGLENYISKLLELVK